MSTALNVDAGPIRQGRASRLIAAGWFFHLSRALPRYVSSSSAVANIGVALNVRQGSFSRNAEGVRGRYPMDYRGIASTDAFGVAAKRKLVQHGVPV